MISQTRFWIKPAIAIASLLILTWLLPVAPLDPWNLVSPKKIATMILVLTMIQVFGSAMTDYLGNQTGAIFTGFLGGLVSSTATTVSLARRSEVSGSDSREMLTFLSATCAMLFEGLALAIAGLTEIHSSFLIIFIGPILATIGMIFLQYRLPQGPKQNSTPSDFEILPILKLAGFIAAILAVSNIFQNLFGQNGLLALTSIVSLFEIHGSVIANVQLHESGAVSVRFLSVLFAVSVVSSCISKLVLISMFGSTLLRSDAVKGTILLIVSIATSCAIAVVLA